MKPTKKNKSMTEVLDRLSGRIAAIKSNKCIDPPLGCGKTSLNFRDEKSLKEYRISGLCQECQDEIF